MEKRPAGVEPATEPWKGPVFPLHHGRLFRQGIAVEIRRVRPEDWRELRDTRLNALWDAPDAFGGSYDVSLARPEQWWVDWARDSAEGGKQAMFLAWHDGRPVGIAGTYRDEGGRWIVISMWVRPAHQGQGIGRRLLDAVVGFIRAQGAREAHLGVADGNTAARRLYETYGFADTGDAYPLRDGSQITVRDMKLTI
jgi:ribosomal protein S18 acetylase RimI-like enzyme